MRSVYGRGLIYDLLFRIEGASVDGDILKGDILDPAMGIVVGDVAGDEQRYLNAPISEEDSVCRNYKSLY